MNLRILTPEKELLNVEVEKVTLPGRLGEMTVLPGHTRLVSRLKKGNIRYLEGGNLNLQTVDGGLFEVRDDVVTVLLS